MLPKEIKYGAEAREKIMEGANGLANAVKVTLGPRGRNVMIDKGHGQQPRITKDGVTVAREIYFRDKFKNMGAQVLREVANKACDKAGDGTTTATVLAQAIFTEGSKAVAAGMNPIDLKRGIDIAVIAVVENIKAASKPVTSKEEWTQVATLSANGDKEVGEKIAEAIEKVGREGVVTVEENKGIGFELKIVDGLQFDRGYLSPYFINHQEKPVCEFENPLILLFDKKLTHIAPITPLLEIAIQSRKQLLIIADEVEGEALTLLVLNRVKGGVPFCAVRAPGFGDKKREYMDDIAAITGATLITEDFGLTAGNATANVFGKADRVVVTKDDTTLIGGAGNRDEVEKRCVQLRTMIEESTNDYQRELYKQRLAKLVGGVAIIRVGGATELEVKERRDRVDDALHATRAAVEEGIVPGGGVALLYASREIENLKGENDDQTVGIGIVRRAIQVPLKQICINAGLDGAVVAGKLLDQKNTDHGFDAQHLKYVDMIKHGVIDPTKVVRVALQDAASVAGLMITTEVVISEHVEEKKDK